jgi:hypothetical protein
LSRVGITLPTFIIAPALVELFGYLLLLVLVVLMAMNRRDSKQRELGVERKLIAAAQQAAHRVLSTDAESFVAQCEVAIAELIERYVQEIQHWRESEKLRLSKRSGAPDASAKAPSEDGALLRRLQRLREEQQRLSSFRSDEDSVRQALARTLHSLRARQ